MHFFIDVHVGTHVPNELMCNNLRLLGYIFDEFRHISHLPMTKGTLLLYLTNTQGMILVNTIYLLNMTLHVTFTEFSSYYMVCGTARPIRPGCHGAQSMQRVYSFTYLWYIQE